MTLLIQIEGLKVKQKGVPYTHGRKIEKRGGGSMKILPKWGSTVTQSGVLGHLALHVRDVTSSVT
jgi:hypothetical protein